MEHLWITLKRKLNKYTTKATSINHQWIRVQKTWSEITKEECSTLVESMPRRIEAVIAAKGKHTKY